MIVTMYA
jgi:hypothetical protein